MPVDVERQLAALGRQWDATIAHVDMSEITSHHAAPGTFSIRTVEGLGSPLTSDRPPWPHGSNTEEDSEAIMLSPNNQNSHSRGWIALGVVAAAVVLIIVGFLVVGNDDPESPVTSEVEPATTAPPATAAPTNADTTTAEAVQLAEQFIDARNAYDGDAIRSMVADDAEIVEWGEISPTDEYPSGPEDVPFEQVAFLQPDCTATAVGPPAVVTCTYLLETYLSRALGVGPFPGSTFEFEIADGRIQRLVHTPDISKFSPQAFEVYMRWVEDAHPEYEEPTQGDGPITEEPYHAGQYTAQVLEVFKGWLDDTHPGDSAVMFDAAVGGSADRSTTPEALALWEQRVPEFIESLTDS